MTVHAANSAGSASSAFGVRVPLWLTLIFLALSFYGALRLDPFGIGTASSERSQQAALRLTAPYYAPSGKVAVVLVDDGYLKDVDQTWPLSYGQQGRLVRSILDARPAVLFLDILYRQRHGRDGASASDPLELVAPISNRSTTRLIFAAQLDADLRKTLVPSVCEEGADERSIALSKPDSLLAPLQQWVDSPEREARARVALLGWWGCGDRYPLTLPGQTGTEARTHAMAMLEEWCGSATPAAPRSDPGCGALKRWMETPPAAPMIIRWGGFPPESQRQFYAAGTCQAYGDASGAAPSVWSAFKLSVRQFAVGLFEDLRQKTEPDLALPCPAVTVIPASLLRSPEMREQVNALLADKIVVLGVRVSGVQDWHQGPVHGQVAGALLHAMAADNLLSLGGNYVSEMSPPMGIAVDLCMLALIALFLTRILATFPDPESYRYSAFGLAMWLLLAIVLAFSGAAGRPVILALLVGISMDLLQPKQSTKYLLVTLLLAVGTVVMMSLGLAPTNWIGLILVVLAFIAAAKPYIKAEELKVLPHRWSLIGQMIARIVERPGKSPPMTARVAEIPGEGDSP